MERLVDDPDLFLAMSELAVAQVRRLSGFEQTISQELRLLEACNSHVAAESFSG